ncbi:hypothetical protein [Terrabacter sp. Soil810]|uniref:hypothetical protein n=1 Tax=Terrabacter sp. Soil810 TaxID=1736418 RepID=UPI001F438AA9|nr:hypothetical protein [Terrabacter sp. Soil810]
MAVSVTVWVSVGTVRVGSAGSAGSLVADSLAAGSLAAGSLADGCDERSTLGSVVGRLTDPLPEHAARTEITARVASALAKAGMRLMADCARTTPRSGVTPAG